MNRICECCERLQKSLLERRYLICQLGMILTGKADKSVGGRLIQSVDAGP